MVAVRRAPVKLGSGDTPSQRATATHSGCAAAHDFPLCLARTDALAACVVVVVAAWCGPHAPTAMRVVLAVLLPPCAIQRFCCQRERVHRQDRFWRNLSADAIRSSRGHTYHCVN
eukprot:scaffold203682_cov31-Tisochrysis_lutea.AAC.1